MATTEETLAQIHADHVRWRSESQWWREEAGFWQDEAQRAIEDLKQVQSAFDAHVDALREHAAAIEHQDQFVVEHEHSLAEVLAQGVDPDKQRLEGHHDEESIRHGAQRAAHERIKRHHFSTIARWQLLLRSLGEAM